MKDRIQVLKIFTSTFSFKLFLLLMLLIAFQFKSFSQEFNASVSKRNLGVGEQFQLTFSADANMSNFRAPNLNDFTVYSGPNQSTSMTIVNGSVTQSVSYNYIIAPKHEGKCTIGAASATVGGKSLQTKPIILDVGKGNQNPQTNRQQNNNNQSSNNNSEDFSDKLFIRAVTSKSKVYQGEQFTVVYKVYTRVNILDNGVTKMPVYNGFYNEDIGDGKRQAELHNENIDGVNYQVAEIKKTLLIPQRSGQLEIDPLEMDIVTRVKTNNKRSNDPFDIFFGGGGFFGGVQDIKVHVKSKSLKIDVLPLPSANKPSNFSGAVGEFSIQTKLKPESQKLKTNDAGNLTYIISGRGNLKLIDAFKIEWPADIEGYDAKTIDKIQSTNQGQTGSRTFDYVFIPRHSGNFTLASNNFSYFDPSKGKYVTLSTPEFNLNIEKGAGGESSVTTTSQSNSKEAVKVLASDIKYIKTKTTLKKIDDDFYGSLTYNFLLVFPMFAFAGIVFNKRRNEKLGSDLRGNRMKQATKIASSHLKIAHQHMQQNDYDNFYREILHAMYGYVSDKFGLPIAQLSKDNINNLLIEKGVELHLIAKLNEVLTNCEFAQYAPNKNLSAMMVDYDNATHVITSIEEKIKS
jgi:hypothetical protein